MHLGSLAFVDEMVEQPGLKVPLDDLLQVARFGALGLLLAIPKEDLASSWAHCLLAAHLVHL